jgi:hypothetical protein
MKKAKRRKEQQTKKQITKRERYCILNGEKVTNGNDVGRGKQMAKREEMDWTYNTSVSV